MDDALLEDEKKPFDADIKDEEDSQPDPDETLQSLCNLNGRAWLVKIPKPLMERWLEIQEENVELAKLRIYEHSPNSTGQGARVILLLPPSDDEDQPTEYELDMIGSDVDNQVVISEREINPGSRARATRLCGRVYHDCNLRPVMNDSYERQMRERDRKANIPQRQIRMIEESLAGGQGRINMLSSGVVGDNDFSNLVKAKPKVKPVFERMARMPRNQLLDMLFGLFREQPRWTIKVLREKTQQPEVYLKEVLSEIAFLHRAGEFNGSWELKAAFKDGDDNASTAQLEQLKAEPGPNLAGIGLEEEDVKLEEPDFDEEEEDEDEDEDDMEEVS